MALDEQDPLFAAAVLKLRFLLKGLTHEPGFRVVYFGTLKDLGLSDRQVDAYISLHRVELEARVCGRH